MAANKKHIPFEELAKMVNPTIHTALLTQVFKKEVAIKGGINATIKLQCKLPLQY
jgi:hypothetical protein